VIAPSDVHSQLIRLRCLLAAAALETRLELLARAIKANYNPNQPRDDHGRWTDGGGGDGGLDDPRVLSDATPDSDWKPGAQYAQNRPPIRGQFQGATPAQQARLAVAEARAQEAIRRVRELDPKWNPTPSLRESVEGAISTAQAEAREAEAHLAELARVGIGPGPYAGESIQARGTGRDFTAAERKVINQIGSETGCHTCGTFNPSTTLGNFVPDHQPPTGLNYSGTAQRLYPQCLTCSLLQGGWVRYLKGSR
jgi:hypothetical protein